MLKESGIALFGSFTIRPAICPAQLALRASLDTVVMSFRPAVTDYGPTGQAGEEGDLDSQWNGVDEHEVVAKERVAVCECFLYVN